MVARFGSSECKVRAFDMDCPSCGAAMTSLTLGGHLSTEVHIDLCQTCQVIWFDRLESLRLAPAATLRLFRVIGDRPQLSPAPIQERLKCPRCDIRLLLTHDRQRNTPFRYLAMCTRARAPDHVLRISPRKRLYPSALAAAACRAAGERADHLLRERGADASSAPRPPTPAPPCPSPCAIWCFT